MSNHRGFGWSTLLATLPTTTLTPLRQPHQVGHGLIDLAGNASRVTAKLTGTTTHILHCPGQSVEEIGYYAHVLHSL